MYSAEEVCTDSALLHTNLMFSSVVMFLLYSGVEASADVRSSRRYMLLS